MTSLFPSPVMSLFPSLDRGRPVGPRPANRPGDPWEQTLRAVGDLAEAGVAALVLETEDGQFVAAGSNRIDSPLLVGLAILGPTNPLERQLPW